MAVETLLNNGFMPKRSIVLAYGIDEERGGEYVCFPSVLRFALFDE